MTKKISAIWAQDATGLIGKDGHLPWVLPADLQHFKETTTGHAMVMGRVTFEGMGKRVLPNRTSIVLTKDPAYTVEDARVLVMTSVAAVLSWYENQDKNLYVIGGGQVFSAFEDYIDEVIVTEIDATFEGDTYFPEEFDQSLFEEISIRRHEKDEKNTSSFTIRVGKKRS